MYDALGTVDKGCVTRPLLRFVHIARIKVGHTWIYMKKVRKVVVKFSMNGRGKPQTIGINAIIPYKLRKNSH